MAKDTIRGYFSSGKNKIAWEKAKEAAKSSTGFGEYDDGKYNAQLVNIEVGRSEGSGRLQAVLSFKFTSGEYKGKTVRQYQGIEDQGIEYLLKTLKVLGYDDVELDDLEDSIFKELKKSKPMVSIRLKTKEGSEYQNVYVVKPLDEDSKEEESDDQDESDDTENTSDDADESADEAGDTDDDDDEGGEEESANEDSDDDEDEKPEPEDKDEDEDEKESEDQVELEVGMKVKVQHEKEVQKAKIVKMDETKGKERIKVKLADGEKVWVKPDAIVDVIA